MDSLAAIRRLARPWLLVLVCLATLFNGFAAASGPAVAWVVGDVEYAIFAGAAMAMSSVSVVSDALRLRRVRL